MMIALSAGDTLATDDIAELRKKAGDGEIRALFDLAGRHELGDGVAQDLARAAALYEQAARRGHGEAQYRFGMMLGTGLGQPADPAAAIGWLNVAADGETTTSILAAGLLDALGETVDQAGQERGETFADTFEPVSGPLDPPANSLLDPIDPLDDTLPAADDRLTAEAEAAPSSKVIGDDRICGQRELQVTEAETRLVGFVVDPPADPVGNANGATADLNVIEVASPICDLMRLLTETTLIDPDIDLVLRNQDEEIAATFADGDTLVIDAAAGDVSRQVFIDYVVHDGTVVHLFPNTGTPDNQMPPSDRMQIGGPGAGPNEWQVAPPFGNDLVILYASAAPLHETERPEIETVDTYLSYLRERLPALSEQTEIGIDYNVVQITPR